MRRMQKQTRHGSDMEADAEVTWKRTQNRIFCPCGGHHYRSTYGTKYRILLWPPCESAFRSKYSLLLCDKMEEEERERRRFLWKQRKF